jgi:hypothetical protein
MKESSDAAFTQQHVPTTHSGPAVDAHRTLQVESARLIVNILPIYAALAQFLSETLQMTT